jgi:hypothetical protein
MTGSATCGIAADPHVASLMRATGSINVIARSACDEAIQLFLVAWIVSLSLAMTMFGV